MIQIDIQKKLRSNDGDMLLHVVCDINEGDFISLYGKSGAGKTSTLRMLSGLMTPDSGSIIVNDDIWYNSKENINVKPQLRNIGYVFQDYALFPNMTVLENLKYARPSSYSKQLLTDLIDIVELGDLQNQKPITLSGGQKQRVALARAVVQEPKLLLLDEPLAALDRAIRVKLQDYLSELHQKQKLTTVLISHDIAEIMKLSGTVMMIDNGKITNQGSPEDIFVNNSVSGKFKFTGEVLSIKKEDVVYIVTVLIQNQIVKVIAEKSEIKSLAVGDQVMVASKAFNPLLIKINTTRETN